MMYEPIYSVQSNSCGGTFALLGGVPIVIGVIILLLRPHRTVLRTRGTWYPLSMIIGGCVWSLAGFLLFLKCSTLRESLVSGRTEVLEGTVQQYEETAKEAVFKVEDR